MAFNPKNYPPYWKQFSEHIRFERAQNKCERCGAQNGDIKYSFSFGQFFVNPNLPVPNDLKALLQSHQYRKSKIVLTVAHLDYRGGVCQCKSFFGFKCARPSHVLALCQSCHLALDREKHVAVRAKNLAAKKDAKRGLLSST